MATVPLSCREIQSGGNLLLRKWIESLYQPQVTNFKDAALDDLMAALENQAVRRHWMDALIEELRAINVGVDRAMREGKLEELPSKSDRRRTIVWVMNQILESQTAIETEMYEQQHNNPLRAVQ